MLKITGKTVVFLMLAFAFATQAFGKSKSVASAEQSTSKRQPEWVDNPYSVYPSDRYFATHGEGDERTAAEVNAIAGIASIFTQSIKTNTASSRRMEQAVIDGKVAFADISSIDTDTRQQVDSENLIGVEIKDSWLDTKSGRWHTVAVLDKTKTSELYLTMIKKNSDEIARLIDVDESDSQIFYSFETYARFDLAKDIAEQNESYLVRFQVINPSLAMTVKDSFPSSKTIAGRNLDIASKIPIYIEIENDNDNRLAKAFSSVIAQAGFRTSGTKDANYFLTGSVSYSERETKDGKTVQCSYVIDASLRNSASEILIPFSVTGREGSTTYSDAQNRSVRTLEGKIKSEFQTSFAEFLSNLAAY